MNVRRHVAINISIAVAAILFAFSLLLSSCAPIRPSDPYKDKMIKSKKGMIHRYQKAHINNSMNR